MQPIPLIALIILGLLVIYIFVYKAKQRKGGGEDKLINRDRPPADIDDTKAGGGLPRDTYPGKR